MASPECFPPPTRSINASPKSALLVENDKSLSSCFKIQLETEGYAVRSASNSEEGLRLFRDLNPFNVVLINYYIPPREGVGIDCLAPQIHGVQLAMAIRDIVPLQGIIIAALDYTSAAEVPRPPELMRVPLLIDNGNGELRRLLEKVEVSRAIEALTVSEKLKLRKFAELLVRRLGRAAGGEDWEDLLKEAFLRTWIGTESRHKGRHWNKKVDFVRHLTETMRSISNSWSRQRSSERDTYLVSELSIVDADGRENSPLDSVASKDAPADQDLIESDEMDEVVALFDQDLEAKQVLRGRLGGLTDREIKKKYRFDEKRYVAIMKRIRELLGHRAHA